MSMVLKVFKIVTVPERLNASLFLDAMLGSQFMIVHKFGKNYSFIISEDIEVKDRLTSSVLGMGLEEVGDVFFEICSPKALIAFDNRDYREKEGPVFQDMHKIFGISDSELIISFVPAGKNNVKNLKEKMEELASNDNTRISRNFGSKAAGNPSGSIQSELYYDSEKRRLNLAVLNNLSEIMINNGVSYRVSLILAKDTDALLEGYVSSKMSVLGIKKLKSSEFEGLWNEVKNFESLPMSYRNAAFMLNFPDTIKRLRTINTRLANLDNSKNSIFIGTYVEGSISEQRLMVRINPSTMNLGTLITGLPGSGKTFAAMNMLQQIKETEDCCMAMISPTEEWGFFGDKIGIRTIKFHENDFKINFFKCENGNKKEKFYENLAMLLAHASNAGPYRNAMEKCLLSAFSKVYSDTLDPDPVYVYEKIEEAIVESHGKRSGAGIRYSKHGENIKAALQNLRLVLLKPQFAYNDGINLFETIKSGVVFDLSGISNSMKPFLYALTLNQIYAFTDLIDEEGNDRLRMIICLEEAQIVFDTEEQSAAMLDLRQRIQDFRKKGIGIVILTHSVTDINLRIRRLCQTKMYFRQSADAVKYAANDLIFEDKAMEDLADRLKTLEHRTCAVNYIISENGMKNPAESLFVRIPEYELSKRHGKQTARMPENRRITKIQLLQEDGSKVNRLLNADIRYLGGLVCFVQTDGEGVLSVGGLLGGKKYIVVIHGKTKKDTMSFEFLGGENVKIVLKEEKR